MSTMNTPAHWLFLLVGTLGGFMLLANQSTAQTPLDEQALDQFITAQLT